MVEDATVGSSEFETVVVGGHVGAHQSDEGGKDSGDPHSAAPNQPRLLLASSRARNIALFPMSINSDVLLVTYKYESSTFDTILAQVASVVDGKKMESIGVVLHGTENQLYLCGPGEKVLTTYTVNEDVSVREFFKALCDRNLERTRLNARLDFLAAHTAHTHDGPVIASALQSLLEVPVSMSVDLQGTDVEVIRWRGQGSTKMTLGDLYFDQKKLKEGAKMAGPAAKTRKKDLDNYEMIRTVGKGAFGTAVLYRKKEDDSLVIIKEINMLELSAAERQMSLTEVNVLAMLDHPNIVRYMDSFEKDTKLCIEMEYCDGGSLAQFLTQQSTKLEEKEILVIFHQICAAIRNIHDHQILHRDLKTANIFLTKAGIVRVGDFGISKMLSTRQAHANTVLGTPYYISPEMCEGKQYDEKSDIWALGCILYEMACLQKTFEGSNLPALVNKIMKGQFAPIKGNYSPGFKQLVRDLLQRDPDFRPTAAEIVTERVPELLAQFSIEGDDADDIDDELKLSVAAARQNQARSSRPLRSVVYHMKVYSSSISLTPVPLPPRTRVKEISVSNTHVIVLTAECLVYTWGEGRKGQLGHGHPENWRSTPTVVEALRGKTMTRVVAGDGFSVFASDNGIIMTCGDGTAGCLGHGDWNSTAKPMLVEKLLSVDVASLACGTQHVVVVGAEGDVYSWGKGEGGRLGQGNEEDCCIPTEIELIDDALITNVRCGGDGTILVSDQGVMYACGNNTNNKLGLCDTGGLFSVRAKKDVEKALIPTRVRSMDCRVVDVSMGPFHTAVLKETGQVVTFGRNTEGQLGRGNCKPTTNPVTVKDMQDRIITMVQCGSTFTVVGTLENAIYLWGTRAVLPASRPTTQDGFSMSWSRRGTPLIHNKDPDFNFADSSRSTVSSLDRTLPLDDPRSNNRDLKLKDVLLQPQEILALYASPAQVAKGETVNLASLHCQNQSVFVVVDTTAPLPKHLRGPGQSLGGSARPPVGPPSASILPTSTKTATTDRKMSKKEMEESIGPVPDWLRAELNDAEEVVWSGSKPEALDINDRPHTTPSQLPSQINSRATADTELPKPKVLSDGRPRRTPPSRESSGSLPQSPFTPSSPTNEFSHEEEARRFSKANKKHPGAGSSKRESVAEEMRIRRMNRELILKEQRLKAEVNEIAKEKESALQDEVERLRAELMKHQDDKQTLKNKMSPRLEDGPVSDSTTCSVM